MGTHLYRISCAHGLLMAALCCTAPLALAGDVSRLSDFDFPSAHIAQNGAWISQNGNHNNAAIDQGPAEAGMLDRQYADIAQAGDGNQATVLQKGDQNRVRISQDGGGNSIDLVQSGDGNQLIANQNGNHNSINGNGINTSHVGNDFDGSIIGPAIQSGLRNSMTVVQNNDGNNLSAVQMGDDNVIIFTQNGGNTARLSEMGNGNTINYTQVQGGLNVDVALKGNQSYGLSVKVN